MLFSSTSISDVAISDLAPDAQRRPRTVQVISQAVARMGLNGRLRTKSKLAKPFGRPTTRPPVRALRVLDQSLRRTELLPRLRTHAFKTKGFGAPTTPPAPPPPVSGGAYPYEEIRKRRKRRDARKAPTESYLPVSGDGPDAAEGMPPDRFAAQYIAAREREQRRQEEEDIQGALLWMMMDDDQG